MTIILEREFERKGGLRAHGSKQDTAGRPSKHILSGRRVILHRLSEDIMTSNVFGVLEKLDPMKWLRPLLGLCFDEKEDPELFDEANYRRGNIKFYHWLELGEAVDRPADREEGSTQVDLFIDMAKAVVSFEIKLSAQLAKNITTDKRAGVNPSLWWDQAIRNIERGYVYAARKHPGKAFFFVVLAMEGEDSKTAILSKYKGHPEEIQRKVERGHRWKDENEMKRYFDQSTYVKLSRRIAWLTWQQMADVLASTRFSTETEELFRMEVVEYIRMKEKLYHDYVAFDKST